MSVPQPAMAEVIRLNHTEFHEYIDDLVKAFDEDRLKDFISIHTADYEEGKDLGGVGYVRNYWFSEGGGGCINCVGMVEYMKQKILDFLKDA